MARDDVSVADTQEHTKLCFVGESGVEFLVGFFNFHYNYSMDLTDDNGKVRKEDMMNKIVFAFLTITILGLSPLNVHASFTIETIDSLSAYYGAGNHASVLDSNGALHVVYGYPELYYASNQSGHWVTEKTNSSRTESESSIAVALDSHNKIHVSYYDDGLKYTTNKSGSWLVETVHNNIYYGIYSSIAIGFNDIVYISYNHQFICHVFCGGPILSDLLLANNQSEHWESEIISTSEAYSSTIYLDHDNNIHIAYYNDNRDLIYMTNKSGTWVTETVDSGGDVGRYCSMALDNNNTVHISYYDSTNKDLKYASNHGGSWTSETIDDIGEVGNDTSLAISANNKIFISYYDLTNENLKYAYSQSEGWSVEIVDGNSSVGQFTSISVDNRGYVHISYEDDDNDTLLYASNAPESLAIPIFNPFGLLLLIFLLGASSMRYMRQR